MNNNQLKSVKTYKTKYHLVVTKRKRPQPKLGSKEREDNKMKAKQQKALERIGIFRIGGFAPYTYIIVQKNAFDKEIILF